MAKRKSKQKRKSPIKLFVKVLAIILAVGLGAIFVTVAIKKVVSEEANDATVMIVAEALEGTNVSELASDHNAVSEDGLTYAGRYGELLADEENCKTNHIYPKNTISADEVTLLFAGDVGLAEGYANLGSFKDRGESIEASFDEDTLTVMREADIFMVNNEFTYTTRGTATAGKQYTFRADPKYVKSLFEMGVDVVSLANNHTYDFGEISMTDTLDTLEAAGMPYVGAGYNRTEAIKPTYFIANDMKIAIVSATQIERNDNPDTRGATDSSPGTFRCWNNDKVCDVVKEAAANSDYVVAYIHWGTELEEAPDWAQLELAPKLAEAGADIIIGDHPHVLQRFDYVGDTPVIYSLGNYWFNSKTLDTGLVEVVIDNSGNTKSVRFVPAIQSGCKTNIVFGADQARILNYMQSISPKVTINSEGYVSKKS